MNFESAGEFQLRHFSARRKVKPPGPMLCIQGGGAKGSWQGGLLNSLLAEKDLHPISIISSSAGSINSWLAAVKLHEPNSSSSPFLFWYRTSLIICILTFYVIIGILVAAILFPFYSLFALVAILICILLYVVRGLYVVFISKRSRVTPPIPFRYYRYLLKFILPKKKNYPFYAYSVATNVDEAFPSIRPEPGGAPLVFCTPKGDCIAEHFPTNMKVDNYTAIAVSSCLPFISPHKIDGSCHADGGLYSNLPIDFFTRSGSLGSDFIICIMATPVNYLAASSDVIEYRSLKFLHELKDLQFKHLSPLEPFAAKTMPASAFPPVLVVQPKERLKSETLKGFFRPCLMKKEYDIGGKQGDEFVKAFQSFERGNLKDLSKYQLLSIDLPALPENPPKYRWSLGWIYWVNKKWIGKN